MSLARRVTTADRPEFPNVVADIGEDPARFLSSTTRMMPLARIRGLDSVAACNAWAAVERRSWGGRSVILDAIDDRRTELQATGDNGDLTPRVRAGITNAARLQEVVADVY